MEMVVHCLCVLYLNCGDTCSEGGERKRERKEI